MRFTRGHVWELKNAHNSVTVQNQTHVYMKFFDHKNLGNHLLQLCPKVVKHPVCHSLVFVHSLYKEYHTFFSPCLIYCTVCLVCNFMWSLWTFGPSYFSLTPCFSPLSVFMPTILAQMVLLSVWWRRPIWILARTHTFLTNIGCDFSQSIPENVRAASDEAMISSFYVLSSCFHSSFQHYKGCPEVMSPKNPQ